MKFNGAGNMMKVFFGSDAAIKAQLTQQLDAYQITYQAMDKDALTKQEFLKMMAMTSDFFELLSPSLYLYKLDNRTSLNNFIDKVLSDKEKNIRFPLVIFENEAYPEMSVEEVRRFLPREYRQAEREQLFRKLQIIDEGRIFWSNFEILRKKSELRWFEFNDLMFRDDSSNLTQAKRNKDRFFYYKHEHKTPPDKYVEKMAEILFVDKEDFFKKTVLDLQTI